MSVNNAFNLSTHNVHIFQKLMACVFFLKKWRQTLTFISGAVL